MSWVYKQALPTISKSNRVMEFASKSYLFCIGKPTPWPNEADSPPDIDRGITSVPEPILYKVPLAILPAILSPCGNKVLHNSNGQPTSWHIFYERPNVPVTHIYAALEVEDRELLSDTYRAIGLYSSFLLASGVSNNNVYLPGSVLESGVLEWVCFHSPVVKVPNRKTRIIEFVMGF